MALYHKHRPQTFADIVDQTYIITTLVNQVKNGKTAHAYLFSGPRGVGKTTTARILAKSLNCEDKKNKNEEPCNKCQTCQEISGSRNIDVIEIDAASHTGVDNVRQNIIDNAQFKPTKSKYKIFIIDEVHMLSTAAFNALLKTLEEPPEYVVFILATTDPHKLPATIISRCQRFGFGKVSDDEMKKYLKDIAKQEGIKIDEEVLKRIIRKGEGCVRDAISLLDQLMAAGDENITVENASLVLPTTNIELQLDFSEFLIKKQAEDALKFINDLVEQGIYMVQFSTQLIEFFRALMIAGIDAKLAQKELDLNKDAYKRLNELTKLISQTKIVELIDLTLKRSAEIKSSPLPQLPLEMLVIEWCCGDNRNTKIQSDTNKETNDKSGEAKSVGHNVTPESIEKPTDKKTLASLVKNIVSKKIVNKEDVEQQWKEFLSIAEKEAPSLIFILKMSKLINVENNTITLAVEYKFHQEKLMEKATRDRMENIFNELLQTRIKIDVNVEEAKTEEIENPELQDLASALGGEIITSSS